MPMYLAYLVVIIISPLYYVSTTTVYDKIDLTCSHKYDDNNMRKKCNINLLK